MHTLPGVSLLVGIPDVRLARRVAYAEQSIGAWKLPPLSPLKHGSKHEGGESGMGWETTKVVGEWAQLEKSTMGD